MSADVVDLIMQDHREVERLFDELKDSPEKRPNLLPVLTTLLTAHSRAEEAEVYPVAAEEAGEKEEVSHSQQEHIEADQLLAKLAATDPDLEGLRQRPAEPDRRGLAPRRGGRDQGPPGDALEPVRRAPGGAGRGLRRQPQGTPRRTAG